LNRKFKVNENTLHSLGKYSPFDGEIFNCSIYKTIVRGNIIFDFDKGILQKPGWGKFIRRN